MADAVPAMALALVDGRAILTVTARELGPLIVERLEVEWPGPRKSLAVAELRNRRGQLRAATLIIDRAGVESRVAAAKTPHGPVAVTLEPGPSWSPDSPKRRTRTITATPGGWLRAPHAGGRRRAQASISVDGGAARPDDVRPRWRWCSASPLPPPRRSERWRSTRWRPHSTSSSSPRVSGSPTAAACTSAPCASRPAGSRCAGPRRAGIPSGSPPISATDDADEIGALRRALDLSPDGPARAEVAHLLSAAYEKIGEDRGRAGGAAPLHRSRDRRAAGGNRLAPPGRALRPERRSARGGARAHRLRRRSARRRQRGGAGRNAGRRRGDPAQAARAPRRRRHAARSGGHARSRFD